MTRKLKFRAWDKVKSMYIGFGGNRHSPKFYSHINPQMDCDWNGHFSLVPNFYYGRELDLVYQQYTGLKDKNGVEIYFGDILGTSNDNPEYDIWDLKEYGYTVVKENQYELGVWFSRWHLSIDDDNSVYQTNFVKVIGNIYEHPHLLEESND